MHYVVKKFMTYDGEAYYRDAIWTPKGFPNDREIIRHFVTEVADAIELPSEDALDLEARVDEVAIVEDVTEAVIPPRVQRGRHARRNQ